MAPASAEGAEAQSRHPVTTISINIWPWSLTQFSIIHPHIQHKMFYSFGSLLLLSVLVPPQILGVMAAPSQVPICIPSDPSFDISRIKDYPDKLLLSRISEYFISFTTGNFDRMNDLESDDFHITDIRKAAFHLLPLNRTIVTYYS